MREVPLPPPNVAVGTAPRDPSVHERHGDGQVNPSSRDALRYLGALATLVVGAVHIQQYADFTANNERSKGRGRRGRRHRVCLKRKSLHRLVALAIPRVPLGGLRRRAGTLLAVVLRLDGPSVGGQHDDDTYCSRLEGAVARVRRDAVTRDS